MNRLPCVRCGDSIHPDTAAAHNGLCLPCVRGNTRTIQERQAEQQQRREAERAYQASSEYLHWQALVRRVYDQNGGGFEALHHGDRLYWLLNVLSGEVHNGGFDQFFSNSSGDLYQATVEALTEVGDGATLALLQAAKAVLFGANDVPRDRVQRFHLMATAESESPGAKVAYRALDALDERFYAQADGLGAVLDRLVREHRLYAVG